MSKTKHLLRTIIIGGGYFGQKRIESCQKLKNDFSVVAIVEPDKEKEKAIGKRYGIPVFPSLLKFSGSADLAIIATPNVFHANLAVDALSMGMHVLCEKPLAPSYKMAKQIINASVKYNRFVKTGSNHRFIPFIEKAISLVKSDSIGRVLRINASIGNNGKHVEGGWFWNKKLSGGGTLIDNGCHLLDIVTFLMNDISACSAQISTSYWKKATVEDNASVLLSTKDGQLATISSSWTKWNGYLSLEIWGSNGFILTNSDTQCVIRGNTKGEIISIFDFTKDKSVSYQKELLYFKDCIDNNIPPIPNAEDGARVVRIIESAYKSSQAKKQIFL